MILATTGVEVSVSGLDRVVPGKTYVFVANHQSIYDIPCLFWNIPFQLRIIAKESLGRFPMLGPHLKRTGHMLVDRARPDRSGIFGWASRLTANGLSLIVFPEGHRNTGSDLDEFKSGLYYMAKKRPDLELVPVHIDNLNRVLPRGEFLPVPLLSCITFGPPIWLEAGEPKTEFLKRARESVRRLKEL